jgi:archaellum component FlaC
MKTYQLIAFLMVLQLPSTLSYSSREEVENVSTACSNPSDCKIYLAQNNSTEASVDRSEAKSIESVSEKVESVSNPLGKASESIESISKPIESLSKPLGSVSEPLSSVSQPLGSVSKPVGSYSLPDDSLTNPQESESKIEEGKEETRGLGINSIQGGKGEMGKEPFTGEEKSDSSNPEEAFEDPFKENANVDATGQEYDRIKGTRETYCKWKDENGMIHIESGEKCRRD